MKRTPRRALALAGAGLFALAAAGCVTHTLLIDAGSGRDATGSYVIEGDSLDVFDERIPTPAKADWLLSKREVGLDSSGNLVARLAFDASDVRSATHPIAPQDRPGSLDVERRNHILFEVTEVRALFPDWQALERYGDPDAYVPDDILALEEQGVDTTMSERSREEMDRVKARARQLATVDRYLRQLERTVHSIYTGDRDSAVVIDAMERFTPVVKAHLMTIRDKDPLDVTLEWYDILRDPMAAAASEATGAPPDSALAAADSLEHEYKRWLDLKDDTVQMLIVLPQGIHRTASPEPEEIRGDTLVWSVSSEQLAERDIEIIAAGYSLATVPMIVLAVVIVAVVIAIVMSARRRSTAGTDFT